MLIEENMDILFNEVEKNKDKLINMSKTIWNNPELGYQEFKACDLLCTMLEENGFKVKKNIDGMETAFIGSKKSTKKGFKIAFIAEYDALINLGHACGHNLFCCSAVGAAISLSKVLEEIGGEIVVIGSPAEEGGVKDAGGKVALVRDGYFDDVDVAFMCHADGDTIIERTLVSSANVKIEFKGRSAHAGGCPEKGINALQAGVLTIDNVNAVRQQLLPGDSFNGIIKEGGTLQNTIPDLCRLTFSVRSKNVSRVKDMMNRLEICAKAAAMVTGCEYTVEFPKNVYADTLSNHELGLVCASIMDKLGVPYKQHDSKGFAWDLGNVTYKCPTLGTYLKIGDESLVNHTPEFRIAANTDEGYAALITAAKTMSGTAYEFAKSEELRKKVYDEFERTRK